jgi:5'-deoxynucleotidase YfbR-like HD superfamily hydrolase
MMNKYRRGYAVKRWHTETVLVEQNVGHHSAGVAALLIELYAPAEPPARLLIAALVHDLPESTYGDTPATAKWESPKLKQELDNLDTKWYEKTTTPNPDHTLPDDELALLKMCDLLELFIYSREERDRGNRDFFKVHYKVEVVLHERMRSAPIDSRFTERLNQIIKYYAEEHPYDYS